MPPWRNTVTHDGSFTSSMNNWILWDVEALDVVEDESFNNCLSIIPIFPAVSDEISGQDLGSPVSGHSPSFPPRTPAQLMKKANVLLAVAMLPHRLHWHMALHVIYMPAISESLEWEPIQEGKGVKLKTRYGHYLRANGGLPPWRNSVTHDIPYRTATQDWIIWQIDIVDTTDQSLQLVKYSETFASEFNSPIASWSIFKGNEVNELTRMLEEETRLHNITVCSQSPLDGKLYPLRLQLPPNNVTMKVVVVQNSSEGEKQYRFKVLDKIFMCHDA
ncbi:hypothetical protein E3N88_45920 [Mikania micrantha]|uniref:DUF569 domain-containing protein n=1 Tax=Mikania micrantha TaxID=192012 RepID=A0A5N6L7T8_9ASTR|nr:hypothetical protein E3N88_45920 [Mikania micrantha]